MLQRLIAPRQQVFSDGVRVLLVTFLAAAPSVADEEIDFGKDIRPILSDKCYFCHGPDVNNEHSETDVRLDSAEAIAEVLEYDQLLERIFSDDPDLVMPQPRSKLTLTDAEKDLLRRWVEQGAEFEEHWAFELLPEAVEVPEDARDKWSRGPIDRFVQKQLQQEGLAPSSEAKPLRWLRRLSYDLTGLPPTTAELDQFETELSANGREAAYAAAADRMLGSPAFGEHFAVAWLGAARYADSYGYQSDKLNTQWPYRDWVVKAFNENLPYDDFLTWQIAGDLLENPTREQRLATAFNRLHRLNNEGGAVFEEWRLENVADRVHTFGTAVLGVTMECCRCHDHKYDPISMKDYYSLSAFFNSIDESGVYDRTAKVPSPSLMLPTDEQSAGLAAAREKAAALAAEVEQIAADAEDRYQAWLRTVKPAELGSPDLHTALGFDTPFSNALKEVYHPCKDDHRWASPLDLVDASDVPSPRMPHRVVADKPKVEESKEGAGAETPTRQALKCDGDRGMSVKGVPTPDRWTPFSLVMTLRETTRSPLKSILAHHTRGTDCGYNGWELTIEDGYLESRMARDWPGNGMSVRTVEPIAADQWCQVTATYDGSSQASGLRLYLNGEPLETTTLRDRVVKSANANVMHGGHLAIGQRFRSRGFAGGLIDDVRFYTRALTPTELCSLATGEPIEPTREYYLSAIDEEARSAADRLTVARETFVLAEDGIHEIPVMEETAEPRETHILARGAYDAETGDDTRVTRATFESLRPAFPADQPVDRLGLARWVTDPSHPLTARVAVNRLWANFFGAGLVRSPDNFGLQGETPTHPELLDWLSRDFIENGWDVKRFCRGVVLSATYRQDSRASLEALKSDPENRLLARGPAHRLAAEQIRDTALAASGLLDTRVGGPPVSPYQPGGDLWRESNTMSPAYEQSVGKDLYRRSLYSVWKRTAPLPNMLAFDAETREVCTVNRPRTNTPLQALVLLNDTQFIEAARSLAERALAAESDDPIAWAFRAFTGRLPDDYETKILAGVHADELEYYRANPEEAAKLIAIGEKAPRDGGDAVETATMTILCRVILNLDATVWKR